jgi:hypothetical protein
VEVASFTTPGPFSVPRASIGYSAQATYRLPDVSTAIEANRLPVRYDPAARGVESCQLTLIRPGSVGSTCVGSVQSAAAARYDDRTVRRARVHGVHGVQVGAAGVVVHDDVAGDALVAADDRRRPGARQPSSDAARPVVHAVERLVHDDLVAELVVLVGVLGDVVVVLVEPAEADALADGGPAAVGVDADPLPVDAGAVDRRARRLPTAPAVVGPRVREVRQALEIGEVQAAVDPVDLELAVAAADARRGLAQRVAFDEMEAGGTVVGAVDERLRRAEPEREARVDLPAAGRRARIHRDIGLEPRAEERDHGRRPEARRLGRGRARGNRERARKRGRGDDETDGTTPGTQMRHRWASPEATIPRIPQARIPGFRSVLPRTIFRARVVAATPRDATSGRPAFLRHAQDGAPPTDARCRRRVTDESQGDWSGGGSCGILCVGAGD